MKKIISVLLLIVLTISLSSCNKSNNTSSESDTSIQTDISSIDTSAENITNKENPKNEQSSSEESKSQSSSEEEIKPQSSSEEESKPQSSENSSSGNKSEPIETINPSTPTHTHYFSNATCTEPQKCICGATDGVALGHNFKDGVCTSCDSEDPNYKPSYTSINNKNGVWCAMIMQGTEIYETTFSLFDEMYISQNIWDEFSTIPEEMRQEIRDDVYNNSFYKVYNGKEYYCGSGNDWDVAEPIISGNTIILNIVAKYAPSNAPSAKIVLNRIDENTIIVESVTENYSKGIDILVDIKFVFSAKQ